jgi:bacterioferritin-associated ferredoxin
VRSEVVRCFTPVRTELAAHLPSRRAERPIFVGAARIGARTCQSAQYLGSASRRDHSNSCCSVEQGPGGINSAAFGLRRAAALARYDLNSMIVCSCNVLSDQAVRDLVTASGSQSLTAHEVYGCLGCDMQCGRCARAVKRILNETLADRAGGCPGCPAKRPSDKVDCSISVTIHGGVSAAANAQANINDRNFG